MIGLSSLNAYELGALSLIIGLFSAKLLSVDELNVVGNSVVAIGGIMLTIAAQEQLLKSQAQTQPDVEKVIEEVQQQVAQLEEKVIKGDAAK